MTDGAEQSHLALSVFKFAAGSGEPDLLALDCREFQSEFVNLDGLKVRVRRSDTDEAEPRTQGRTLLTARRTVNPSSPIADAPCSLGIRIEKVGKAIAAKSVEAALAWC